MKIIRPINPSDLDHLVSLTEQATFGLTSLPKDRELLSGRVDASLQSFQSKTRKPGGYYLFVMEERETGKIVGTCGIDSKVGGYEPFYAYRIETTFHESIHLNVKKKIRALHLEKEHNGPSEIGSLFLLPESRGGGAGRFLSLSRFLFMAEHKERFERFVIAEMRGVIDETGHSPFWEALGRHFFDIDFAHADYQSMRDKRFIAELMPTHPIYIPLLPEKAQEVIGQVHPDTRPALRLLEKEGFEFSGMVDIFEGGPVVSSAVESIRTVKESVNDFVAGISDEKLSSPDFIISNACLDFRACLGTVVRSPGEGVLISREVSEALNVGLSDRIRFAPLK